MPGELGHTRLPSRGSVSLPGRDCMPGWGLVAMAFPAQGAAGVSPVPSRGTGSAALGAALGGGRAWQSPRRCPGTSPFSRDGMRHFRRARSPWRGGHCLARLLPGPGEGKAAPELWEQELVGVPKRRVQPRRGVRKGGKPFPGCCRGRGAAALCAWAAPSPQNRSGPGVRSGTGCEGGWRPSRGQGQRCR